MRIRISLVILGAAFAAACHHALDLSFTGVTGSYTLVKIDGSPLPFKNSATTNTVRGQLELKTNGNYALSQVDSGSAGKTNVSSSGTWNLQQGAAVLLLEDGGGSFVAGVNGTGDTLQLSFHSHQNLYVRPR